MKYKVITTFKPGDWDRYTHRMVVSVLEKWPDVNITVYYEGECPDYKNPNIEYVEINNANKELQNFRIRHGGDPVANGKLFEIPGGVRRSKRLETEGGLDAKKESYLWNAVKFSFKVSCITHAVKTYTDYDYVIWLDDDTYTFRPIPKSFIIDLCPKETLVTYLGRENNRGSNKYPECGLVCYNINHNLIQNFVQEWENLYTSDKIFELLEWHDSYVFWYMTKEYRKKLDAKVHDIGYKKGVKGHHVFVNSILGQYIDHFKGDRKSDKKSRPDDIRKTPELKDIDYWKNK